ncbi:nickel uptake transporter family protein [Sphingopyxis witflariensis]|uniref:Nickel uptake transporter family protein n=1 Tax=Sphingopyxis witflariensis TaxID=173675 RepID=A0A2D0AN82_9SPHN|nr:nickel uptake transporter family protein [Sphingopyxis witflariensis]OWQ95207.1 nickel uptake transporter family protein [Sphingopyxis witflariensis]
MRYALPFILAATAPTVPAAAHEVWVERDGAGAARIYLGEPAEPVPAAGDPELHRLKTPLVFLSDPAQPAVTTRRANHLEAALGKAGDVRVRDDSVFDPWESDGGMTGAIFYARAGRSESISKLDLEFTPVRAGADEFTVQFRGRPVAGAKVNIISPDHWQKSLEADAAGRVAVPDMGKGRYILAVSHKEDAAGMVAGKPVGKLQHISTLTFVR